MKFDLNFLTGIVSLFLFCICGILSVSGGVLLLLISILLFFIAAAGIMILYSALLPSLLKMKSLKTDWFMFAPFSVMLLCSRIFLGWNVFVPFCAAAFMALTYDIVAKNEKALSGAKKAAVTAAGAFSTIALTAVSFIGGVLL